MNDTIKKNQRRRILSLAAYSTAALIMPNSLWASAKRSQLHKWQGRALGAETSIQLFHHDKSQAEDILGQCVSFIRKYERIFSLFDPMSEISMLNEQGKINEPDAEFIKLIKISQNFSAQTNGAFDITIQPLWNLYKKHFENKNSQILTNEIAITIGKVGWQNLMVDNDQVIFKKQGMAISFNGIAQGYITDKVTEFLKEQGFDNSLIDIGEYRAAGPQLNGDPWRIGLLDPFDQASIADIMEITTGAVATSGGYGDIFDISGQYHHIFNPKNGLSSNLYASVSVKAATATTADALSTAFSNMSYEQIEDNINKYNDVEVRITLKNGKRIRLKSS